VLPFLESSRRVDLRIITLDIPRQEVITRDNIPVIVNTVVYFKVERPEYAIVKIENYRFAVQQYTQSAIRDVVGTLTLDEVLTEREQIATEIQNLVDQETEDWGIDINALKMQEIEVPDQMKRAMAIQAEAEREKRASIIASEGELEASKNIQKAAELMSSEPGSLHLRTLQTIRDISDNQSEKIVIFLPSQISDFMKNFTK
jgi:regulator of protease activity HflC (stomatin/prohibitin superfamily)